MSISERSAQFSEIRGKVQTYLLDPSGDNPYDDVNGYFRDTWGLSKWCPEASLDAMSLLDVTQTRMRELMSTHFDAQHGTLGTIATGLPYFYPLHLTILSWLVYGRVEGAQEFESSFKVGLASAILEQVKKYDVYGYDIQRHSEYVQRALLHPIVQQESITPNASVTQSRPRQWYLRFNPFRK